MRKEVLGNYGMILVLAGLCVLFSVLTLERKAATGEAAVAEVVRQIGNDFKKSDIILAVGAANKSSAPFAKKAGKDLKDQGFNNARIVVGIPRDLRLALKGIQADGGKIAVIATSGDVPKWRVIDQIPGDFPEFDGFQVVTPKKRLRSGFLKPKNLLAIVNRIVVIAVIAIGMTMVIITAGIDLSVGSLIALSAVVATLFMKKWDDWTHRVGRYRSDSCWEHWSVAWWGQPRA